MLKGQDNFPKTVTRANDMIRRYKTMITSRNRNNSSDRDMGGRDRGPTGGRGPTPGQGLGGRGAHMFVQRAAPAGTVSIPGSDGCTVQRTQCYGSSSLEHFSDVCPNVAVAHAQTGQTMVQIRRCLTQGDKSDIIDDNWLLLNSCSTASCIKNLGSVHAIKT